VLQCFAAQSTLKHTCNNRVVWCVAVCCSALQCDAVCCSTAHSKQSSRLVCCRVVPCAVVLQSVAAQLPLHQTCNSSLEQYVVEWCVAVLQCVSVCYRTLKYVAVCCSTIRKQCPRPSVGTLIYLSLWTDRCIHIHTHPGRRLGHS